MKTAAERAEEIDDSLKTFMFVIPKVCCCLYQPMLTPSHHHLSQTFMLVSLHRLLAGNIVELHPSIGKGAVSDATEVVSLLTVEPCVATPAA